MILSPIKTLLVALALGLSLVPMARAQECVGRNLFDTMPQADLAAIRQATAQVPYHRGLFWQAQKGDQRITLIGTYHFQDPRHGATMQRFGPEIDRAAALLVEAGPEEEARLSEAMASDPALIIDATGPTLPERLSPAEWAALSQALEARGLPVVVASRMRPWYVAMMLGLSPCMLRAMQEDGEINGLDHQLIARAQSSGTPVQALEPWDTVFTLFQGLTPEQEEDMLRAAMPAAEYADDYAVTLSDAYFAGESWMIWEFGRVDAYRNSGLTRAQVDAQMRLARERLMDRRNESWIAPLEKAAADAQDKGIVAGFGALHLPGEGGVLRLLERRGWTIRPLTSGPGPEGDGNSRSGNGNHDG